MFFVGTARLSEDLPAAYCKRYVYAAQPIPLSTPTMHAMD